MRQIRIAEDMLAGLCLFTQVQIMPAAIDDRF